MPVGYRPRLRARQDAPSYKPIPGPPLPHHNTKAGKIRPLVHLGNGSTLAQPVLPPLPGQVGFTGDRPQDNTIRPAAGPDDLTVTDEQEYDLGPYYYNHGDAPADSTAPTRHARKRENQATRWLDTVIPLLIPIYMELVQKNREPPHVGCYFTEYARMHLHWGRVEWEGQGEKSKALEEITIRICPCSLAAPQLLQRGYFACAPLEPTLAIELRLLEFVRRLFLNIAPNNTALANTLETFLDSMGYKLENRDALRRRFGNALDWYISMRHLLDSQIDDMVSISRNALPQNQPVAREISNPPASVNAKTCYISALLSDETRGDRQVAHRLLTPPRRLLRPSVVDNLHLAHRLQTPPRQLPRPSDAGNRRLRLRVLVPQLLLRNTTTLPIPSRNSKIERDPAITCAPGVPLVSGGNGRIPRWSWTLWYPATRHPNTLFVPPDVVNKMDAYVDSIRPPRKPAKSKSKGKHTAVEVEEVDDHFEHPAMPVPKSVLDNCEASFLAADEKRAKSSTQFFDDTGLMALNCRHDHALFLVNMKSAGEKQSYMYALLMTLLTHLPVAFVVGLLYDIACQTHRSALKWGFLPPEYLARLQFAVSVLHAYGHHWVCQLKYHPRRRTLFGLSDGEGTEHFWHSISKLVSYLRVCGYHRRLYTLDSQIHHLQQANIRRLGAWLARWWDHCETKRREANEALRKSKQPLTVLREQYKKQVEAQTKPLPKRKKNAGKHAVEEVIRLRKAVKILEARIQHLEDVLIEGDTADAAMAEGDLQTAWEKLSRTKDAMNRKEQALGVQDRKTLQHLKNSKFITARMNARALKYRVREKLRNRKFELDRVERTYHRKKTDGKMKTHIEDAVKRRDPGIQSLVRQYNNLCKQMSNLIAQRKAPRNALAPTPIDMKGIWALDVNDEIWQDVGLDDAYEQSEPPLWLSSEAVRDGIKAMLELDRCDEEAPRLFHECRALHYWLSEEWAAVCSAIEERTASGDVGLIHQLQLRREELCKLCKTWKAAIRLIPFNTDGLPDWGPSEDDLNAPPPVREDDGDTTESDEEEEEEEEIPIDEIEAFQRAGVYAEESGDYYLPSGDSSHVRGANDDEDWFAQ
ncbi:hypothetical protein MSAN_01108000 [Mycena sanguinolenta]|uniref:CxC1-like cysteine cluster associated with KDZ transposases domain-containing protein n=1 Tax=Mycena sanguinolenta TaxID=230812 RepID=A0A8H7DAB0_9AGAR|nr:hypothetical protein MSAN_01108000 [Mycena sanguinolenta]